MDSVIHFNWTKTKGVKSAAQLISTPKGAHGAQNWWVICSRRISYNPLQSQTSCAINHITTADVRPREHHLQFCLMFFTVETKRGKKKEKRKTCDKLQRLRKPCGMRSSQTPIMMHMSILLNYLGWQNLETQLNGKFRGLWWCKNLWIALHLITSVHVFKIQSVILRSDLFNS